MLKCVSGQSSVSSALTLEKGRASSAATEMPRGDSVPASIGDLPRLPSGDEELDGLVAEAHFPARVQAVSHERNSFSTIDGTRGQADLVFLGLRSITKNETLENYAAYYASLSNQADGLSPTALVNGGRGSESA
jgi:hypothetical protein